MAVCCNRTLPNCPDDMLDLHCQMPSLHEFTKIGVSTFFTCLIMRRLIYNRHSILEGRSGRENLCLLLEDGFWLHLHVLHFKWEGVCVSVACVPKPPAQYRLLTGSVFSLQKNACTIPLSAILLTLTAG